VKERDGATFEVVVAETERVEAVVWTGDGVRGLVGEIAQTGAMERGWTKGWVHEEPDP
jgi:hypothetical protein